MATFEELGIRAAESSYATLITSEDTSPLSRKELRKLFVRQDALMAKLLNHLLLLRWPVASFLNEAVQQKQVNNSLEGEKNKEPRGKKRSEFSGQELLDLFNFLHLTDTKETAKAGFKAIIKYFDLVDYSVLLTMADCLDDSSSVTPYTKYQTRHLARIKRILRAIQSIQDRIIVRNLRLVHKLWFFMIYSGIDGKASKKVSIWDKEFSCGEVEHSDEVTDGTVTSGLTFSG